MNEANTKIKQQIVEKIKSTTNILVTVGRDPSVDDLSAALGLTALLNKLDKHATAIFSGVIPPAISFLKPDKVFENTADSLRDFIIALDKEKADHLRYKVEGDVVKIFITPYRTTITSDDLQFSQGDFNVELVLALGVENQEHLDTALAAHGQMIHDVTIMTLSAGEQSSKLGSVDWRDEKASSLCEMVTSLADTLKVEKTLLDKQISTALLTGIVAATDRFSNPRTSASVMSMAAQLMAAGADQQLIASKLQESHAINALPSAAATDQPSSTDIPAEAQQPAAISSDGSLVISHDYAEEPVSQSEVPVQPVVEEVAPEESVIEPVEPALLQPDIIEPPTQPPQPPLELPEIILDKPGGTPSSIADVAIEPSLGGTLNATSDQAADDTRRELEDQKNKTILSHSYLSEPGADQGAAINSTGQDDNSDQPVDIFSSGLAPTASTLPPEPVIVPSPEIGLPLPPPLPDFSTLPPAPPIATPVLPDVNTFIAEPAPGSTLPPASTDPNDPSQFKIPGQA